MQPHRNLTPAEKRVLSTMRTHGNAVRIWNRSRGEYSWWIADRPVTRVVHSLAVKGHLKIEGDQARPTANLAGA